MTSKLKDMLSRVSAQSLKPTLALLAASLVMAIGGALNMYGADIQWDAGGDDNYWSTPANWVGDSAPASTDNVKFDYSSLEGDQTVELSADASVASMYIWSYDKANYKFVGNGNTLTLSANTQLAWGDFEFNNLNVTFSSCEFFLAADRNNDIASLTQNGGEVRLGNWTYLACQYNNGVSYCKATYTLDGGGSFGGGSDFHVAWGESCTGIVNIVNGSVTAAYWTQLGEGPNSVASLTVGSNGSWTQTTAGDSSFVMANGANAEADVSISGTFSIGGALAIGAGSGSKASFTVENGGSATIGTAAEGKGWAGVSTVVGSGENSEGELNLNGGTFTTAAITAGSGSGTVNFNGGTLQASADGTLVASGISMTVGSNGGTIDVGANNVTIAATVTGAGTITKKGTGTLTFTGDMSGFIGKVAVANGAGSVTLPSSAEHARAGDYTSKTENQGGTFTFSYDANGSAAATATATLLNLDFEDDSYAEDASGWVGKTIEGQIINSPKNDIAGAGTSQGTRANGSKYLHLTLNNNASRGVVYVLPTSCSTASEFSLEFDWFSAAGVIYNNAGNNSGFALYDTAGKEIVGVEVPCAGNNNLFDSTVYAGAKEIALGSIKAKRMADPTTETELWHHILITGNASDSSMKLTITDGNGTKKISNVSLGGFVNVAQIYVCLGTKGSYGSVRGGIDNVVFSIPAVAAVNGTPYATFASAVAAATSSSTITLYSDVELTADPVLPAGATLALNGYALYTTDENVAVTFDDGVHYLESTAYAGGYKTFTANVTMDATTYVWTGSEDNTWGNPNNWNLGTSTAPSAPTGDVDVLIPAEGAPWTINVASDASVSHIAVNGNTTLSGGTLRATTIDGAGKITLNGASFGPIYETGELDIYNDLEIEAETTCYFYLGGKNINLYGRLLGKGKLIADHANKVDVGVIFKGNNMEFYGEFEDTNYYSRSGTNMDSYKSSSSNAVWRVSSTRSKNTDSIILNNSTDTFYFGAIIGTLQGGSNSAKVEIGNRSDVDSEFTFKGRQTGQGVPTKLTVTKVGSGKLTLNADNLVAPANQNNLGNIYIKGGILVPEYVPDNLSFLGNGATLQLASGLDPSAVITGSSSAIAFDSCGNDYTWSSALASSNVGGLTKKGAGTLTLTQMPTFTGAITVEEGALVLPAGYSQTLGANTVVVKDDGNTVTLVNGWVITWDVDGVKTTTPVKAGETPTATDPTKPNYTFAGWTPAVVAATANATYTATWTANGVTLGTPSVEWGLDFTNAVVTATVTDGYADVAYTLTYGQTTFAGTVEGTTVTFNVPVAANARYANFNYSIGAAVGGTPVGSASGSAIVADEKAWFSTTANETTNGSWAPAPTVKEGKMTFTESNTFMPSAASSGKIVVIDMGNVCFGDASDAEITGAQAGIRIGANDKFEVLSATGWIETEIPANGEEAYNVVLTINYATKKYSVKIGTGTKDDITLAGSETGVNAIEFNGAGSLESLTGEYFDGAMVKDSAGKTYDTVAEAIAALKARTATAPLTMLHTGTEPAGWTIKDGKLDTAQAEVVIDETPTGTNPVTVSVAVPKACTAATLIDTSNRAAGDILKVWSKTDECYYTWELTSTKAWEPKNTYVITESEATTHSKEASKVNLTAGQAVWVTITTAESVKLLVAYNAAPVAVAVESGWNLVAPTTPGDTTVNAIIASTGAAANDSIVVPTKTVPKVYTKVGGQWGYTTIVEVEDKNGLKIGRSVHTVEDTTIKAGTGVWFVNGSSDSKDINL